MNTDYICLIFDSIIVYTLLSSVHFPRILSHFIFAIAIVNEFDERESLLRSTEYQQKHKERQYRLCCAMLLLRIYRSDRE